MLICEPVQVALSVKTGINVRKFALQSEVAKPGLANRRVFVGPLKVTTARFPDTFLSGT